MQITDIKPTKRGGRYSIYIEGKYSFSLGDLELSSSGLRIGDDLTKDEIDNWKSEVERSKLKSRVLRNIVIRPRSVWELSQYLRRKGYGDEDIDFAIGYATELGYLDDAEFAAKWIEYRQSTTPRSRYRLSAELRAKGVPKEITDDALQTQDRDAQRQALASLIEKKRGRYAEDSKLIGYCVRQGFPIGMIKEVIAETSAKDA